MIKALAAAFPEYLFCPMGDVTRASAAAYLALDNVPCVGAAWVAPGSLIEARDWAELENLARDAAALRDTRMSGLRR